MKKTTVPDELAHRISLANAHRNADGLRRKYVAMSQNAFRFFRATPYLFYQDWPTLPHGLDSPLTWVCGDLHLENFGSYRVANKLVYFDINDFDEALLAPAHLDVARLVTSLLVAAPSLGHPPATARRLARGFVASYCQTLAQGKPRSVERQTATGELNRFLTQVARRSQKALLAQHTTGRGQRRRLRISPDGQPALSAEAQRTLRDWLTPALHAHGGYRLMDMGGRLAGTSSLGLPRYVVLVKNAAHKWRLLDLKAASPSVAEAWLTVPQPAWPTPATRVVTLQHRLQDVSPTLLDALPGHGPTMSFVLRTLQPQADRVDLLARSLRPARRLGALLDTMAQLTASAHLRGSGHQGSAIADALMDFAAQANWANDLLSAADDYAQQVHRDYRQFKVALKAGAFAIPH